MSGDTIDYNALVRRALLGAVRDLLTDASENGLRGHHHYYLAFSTQHPGVKIPAHLHVQHPSEMTIVLQNQFWDLAVQDDYFSVKLSFNSKAEELIVPFDSLIGFLDPSVQFALQFKDENLGAVPARDPDADEAVAEASETAQDEGENVIALDAFRKK
ncbi:MAG: ClpXP protease specificity-enhancing factor SspB [Proteobacteria bacterium]|nr:ClpXP protease specificity-enhancing factor SspB [Pseudomonadota bacterium]